MIFSLPRALLFDLDGVIVSSEQHWIATESDFLAGLLPGWDDQKQSRLLGLSVKDVFALLAGEYGLQTSWDDFVRFYESRARPIYTELAAEVSGATALIKSAAAAGCAVAIVSNSPTSWIEMVVGRFGLAPHLSAVVSSEAVDTPGKPHPGIYLKALEFLNAAPAEALAIEDSPKGIASAKAAGIRCVGLLNGHNNRSQLFGADWVADGFSDSCWYLLLGLGRSAAGDEAE